MNYNYHPIWNIVNDLHGLNEEALEMVLFGVEDMIGKDNIGNISMDWLTRFRKIVLGLLEKEKNETKS